jgi:hypothetical protein
MGYKVPKGKVHQAPFMCDPEIWRLVRLAQFNRGDIIKTFDI